MLRISLDNEQQLISIEEEIKNTKLYIEILQLRYEDKLKVEWQVEEEVLDARIVKVSLQPIIENAVYHGIKPLREMGIIRIAAYRREDYIQIQISDNGAGMSKAEEEKLNEDMREKYILKEGHIGIRNVNQRLKLLLGDEAGIEVQSRKGGGTTILLRIPQPGQGAGGIK